jgi:amino acid adenylation domain-containing protein
LAVRIQKATLTYGELNRKANRIAHSLLARRGNGEEPIGLFFEDSAETIAAMLGALKAGKIYLPLDVNIPPSRATYIVKDAAAKVILTSRASAARVCELAGPDVALVLTEELEHVADTNPGLPISPNRLASLYYTSGSMGAPKGIPSSHQARVINYRHYARALHLTSTDRLILLYSCTFSGAVNNLFGALLSGASLFPFDIAKYGISNLADWIERHQISIYHSVPAIFRGLSESLDGRRLSHLRVVMLASDTADETDVTAFRATCPPACRLANAWGVSEAPFIRPYWVDASREYSAGPLPAIGPAHEADEVQLLDDAGNAVAEGEDGEIVLRGADLAPGYWGKPELTQKCFFTDPNDHKLRRYHTGDLGRRLPDGSIVHLGRKDLQVQIRGYRVELEEIEAALRTLAGVNAAVVVAEDQGQGEKRLVAHVVGESGYEMDHLSLRRQLSEHLPEYMTPELFLQIDALPLSVGGKVDRNALSSLPGPAAPPRERRAPRDRTEQQLIQIWQSVLRIPLVGTGDNFFELGGNSLQALQIALHIERTFGHRLVPSVLIEKPTIEELAPLLADRSRTEWSPLVPLQPHGKRSPLFCIHGTGGHIFFYRDLAAMLGPEQPVYGLQALGLDGGEPPLTDVREIASRYVSEVRRVQPEGPYHLAGSCFGAYVALEMAALLQSHNERVGFLASFNADGEWKSVSSWREAARFHGRRLAPLRWGDRCNYVAERLHYRWTNLRNRVAAQCAGLDPSRLGRFRVDTACDRASRDYIPSPFSGPLVLFQAEQNPHNNPQAFWEPITGQRVEVHRVPGGNETMFHRPHVETLARKLTACLERAKLSTATP